MRARGLPAGLVALALGGFGIGLTEFVILGLLPEVATDFAVTIPQAGHLVSGYALSVAVGGVVVTAGTAALRPKRVLIALMALFVVGNFISAIADTYAAMMAGRIVAALCHGAFFGIGSVLAASLVPAHRKAQAISIMFAGLTLANVLGVPLGTLLGQHLGWRSTFWAITAIGVLALVGLLAFIPDQAAEHRSSGRLRRELAAFADLQVWLSILVTVFGFGAMFGSFTYIAPILTDVTGFPSSAVPWLLVLFGVGLFAGNLIGGRAADRALDRTLIILLTSLAAVLGVFAVLAGSAWAAGVLLFALGAVGFASVPGMQMRVLKYAATAPTLASGTNISAFNLGNAIGAWLGGVAIAAGYGYRSPLLVGMVLALVALGVMTAAVRTGRRSRVEDGRRQEIPVPGSSH